MKHYFGPGFSMTCAGQQIQSGKDGFADVASMTPEIAEHVKPEPAKPITTTKEIDG